MLAHGDAWGATRGADSASGGALGWRKAGIDDELAARLSQRMWAEGTCSAAIDEWSALVTDPYRWVGQVDGYGWRHAEQVAAIGGLGENDPLRNAGLVMHLVRQECWQEGHAYVHISWLRSAFQAAGGKGDFQEALDRALQWGQSLTRTGSAIYPTALAVAEQDSAERLRALCERARPIWHGSHLGLVEQVGEAQRVLGMELNEAQSDTILRIMTAETRLHTLTGGPGCGKTTVMEVLAALVPQALFAAPTGKAALMLSERVGRYGKRAVTVQSLIQQCALATTVPPRQQRTMRISSAAELLVVDESSMVDLLTFAQLLRCVSDTCHVLLVGDPEQLPSVAPGVVLRDTLRMPAANHCSLQIGHRARGDLAGFLTEMRRGEIRWQSLPSSVTHVSRGGGSDPSMSEIVELWKQSVERVGLEEVALLFAFRRAGTGGLNADSCNEEIQATVNPPTARNYIPGSRLRLGDRVTVRRNAWLPDGGLVVNGDVGVLEGWSPGRMKVRMDDGRVVGLEGALTKSLELAYGQTVHSAQGGSAKEVIVVLGSGSSFITRSLLYTACSRASDRLVLAGQRGSFDAAVGAVPPDRRSTVVLRAMSLSAGAPA